MKRIVIPLLALLFSLTTAEGAEASYFLKITVFDTNSIVMGDGKSTFLKGDPEIVSFKKKLTAFAKTSQAKNQAIARCKEEGVYYNTRIKVLDSRRGTAGLGSLRTITVSSMKVMSQTRDLPEYSDEVAGNLESEYSFYSEYPDYIEEGYMQYFVEFKCSLIGIVPIISSNFYQIYVDGDFLGEFSRAELIKMKWSISVREDEI